MANIEDWDDMDFSTEYKICSSLGAMENARYFQEIEGEVFLNDYTDTNKKLIGRLSGVKMLLNVGANDGGTLTLYLTTNSQHLI